MKRVLLSLAIVTLFWGLISQSALAGSANLGDVYVIRHPVSNGNAMVKLAPAVRQSMSTLQQGEMLTVIITLRDQANLAAIPKQNPKSHRRRQVIEALRGVSNNSQNRLRGLLERWQARGQIRDFEFTWVFNGLVVTATPQVIDDLARHREVLRISSNDTFSIPDTGSGEDLADTNALPEPSLSTTNAPAVWALGFRGQGIVVANMDTGVDGSHPDLAAQWRGGSNSWFDPNGQHPFTPTDLNGHGTWTMGVMVGRESGGTAIGMAPEAQWIAVKIFNDQGTATTAAIHQGYQWLLDPDGNPATDDAPDVVNNSFAYGGPGCNLEFQLDLQSLRAAGILPVFSAGNYGPRAATSVSPANYPEAFAVGAVNDYGTLYTLSSHGPSSCGEPTTIYPELVAPGVNVLTTDLYGSYYSISGTSIAAPHVSGALALLLSAFTELSVEDQANALKLTAIDRGVAGPDNAYGYGRLDALGAYNWVLGSSNSSPTPGFTPTWTNAPPATATPTNTQPPPPPTGTPTETPTNTLPPPLPTDTSMPTATSTNTQPAPSPTSTPTDTPTSTLPAPPSPTATQPAGSGTIFADGFESGDFSAWSVASGGQISVNTGAASEGDYGMQAVLNGGIVGYVEDSSPAGETDYTASFLFNPAGSETAGGVISIFEGSTAIGAQIVVVQYRLYSGSYQVRARVRHSGGTYTTGWYSITPETHHIQVVYTSAASASFRLYIDGQLKQEPTGLNTTGKLIDAVKLGPLAGVPRGATGSVTFDAFVSSR